MTTLLDETTKKELVEILSKLKNEVTIYFFQENGCVTCEQQLELLQEITSINTLLKLKTDELESEKAKELKVDKTPATAVLTDKDYGIRYYGITGGQEFSALLQTILFLGVEAPTLPDELRTLIDKIDTPIHLEIMTTLTCPYCTKMVVTAHLLSMNSDFIRSDMVDSAEFPELVSKYSVQGVPKTVINQDGSFEGALPIENVLLELLKYAKPDEYNQLESELLGSLEEKEEQLVDSEKLYDVIIIGAGPAAMSAAIYSARKNRSTAIIGKHIGGQITDTSTIENWPGLQSVGGEELANMMKNHAHHYDIAETFNTKIEKIEKIDNEFILTTNKNLTYKSKSIIYCAGKKNRTLGIEGEKKFIGKGVAFCATCDAPLFKDKVVAVVGGGNSALTAARDLLGYAKKIYLIHKRGSINADESLMSEVLESNTVQTLYNTNITKFIGTNVLEKIELDSEIEELNVDGVFLEIGLTPNTKPIKELTELNDKDEVIVDREQKTNIDGFFAAGDVTDEKDKQIIIAAGAGAKAALSADRYLNIVKIR